MSAGETTLSHAAENGHAQCIEILIRAGLDVNPTGDLYSTPLVNAAKNGHTAAIQVLLRVSSAFIYLFVKIYVYETRFINNENSECNNF